ncbi:Hypothetical predicted protein [Mytilus galloprovincialis]|uniref:C1q domain-containing protein n=1 Tax=Mytilus galloprovincialis TaxID=29158 RepID=A0A8B6BJH1_MYTGA|nr:Hypothetical predicted protein [Mytilus galloprovincialis]
MLDPLFIENEELNSAITIDGIRRLVSRTKNGKSCGIDNIPYEVLKTENVIAVLNSMFQLVFDTSIVPSLWHQAIICPILKDKSSDKRIPLHYRGISLLSCVSKLYSGFINKRVSSYLEDNDLLSEEQNGFRQPTNIVAFSAILDHTMTLGPLQVVKYNKIFTNIGNAYDPHHGHVIIPTKGIYLVSVTGMNDGANDIHLELVRNDDLIGTLYLGRNGWSAMSQTLVLSLDENDLIWVRVYNNNVYAGHKIVGSVDQYYNSFSLLLMTPL